jgi:hypothetical protein
MIDFYKICRFFILALFMITSILFLDCTSKKKKLETNSVYSSFSKDFRIQWKRDSLGKNGFRQKSYFFDTINKTWLINGININGFSSFEIIAILGTPTNTGKGKEDGLLIQLYIVKHMNDRFYSKALRIDYNKHKVAEGITENIGF